MSDWIVMKSNAKSVGNRHWVVAFLFLVSLFTACDNEATYLEGEFERDPNLVETGEDGLVAVPPGVDFVYERQVSLRNAGACVASVAMKSDAIVETCEAREASLSAYRMADGRFHLCKKNSLYWGVYAAEAGDWTIFTPGWIANCFDGSSFQTFPLQLAKCEGTCTKDSLVSSSGVWTSEPGGAVVSMGRRLTNVGDGTVTMASASGAANQAWDIINPVTGIPACEVEVLSDYLLCVASFGSSACSPSKDASRSKCKEGIAQVYRTVRKYHHETRVYPSSGPYAQTVEAVFNFAATKPVGGWPVIRCPAYTIGVLRTSDSLSTLTNCGGAPRYSLAGFSYASGNPVYHCTVKKDAIDKFISRGADCEGQGPGILVGYTQ